MKKDYIAKVYYEATEDSYEEGLLFNGCSNSWTDTFDISANTAKEALAKAIKSTFYDINLDDGAYDRHIFMISILVDEDNAEATKEEVELWKKGEFRLWNLDISISLYKMIEADIEG